MRRDRLVGERQDYRSVRERIASGETTCVELTQHFLRRIDEGVGLNAFVSVFGERALEKAAEVDRRVGEGRSGRLAGMVVAAKDNLAVKGARTTCGSRMLERFVSPYDATAVRRLEAEDAIVIGKANMDEFGMGSSNEHSAFGPARNPHDVGRTPGGSSGGCAAAVASGMAVTGLGTDTGGSVRQPAAFCGVVGLRPTYGRVSRYGLVAFASSLDQVGVLSNTVADCAEVLQVIAGSDPKDATSASEPVPDYAFCLERDVRGVRVGLPAEYAGDGLDEEVWAAVEKVVDVLKGGGARVETVSLPHTEYGVAAYYVICTAEASSNLARYDGVRYGLREDTPDLLSMYTQTRSRGFGYEVKRRLMLGTYVLSAGYYEAYYRKAQVVRTCIRQDFERAFERYDVIVGPTSPTTAFRLGEKVDDPLRMYLSDVYTVCPALAGVPAVSIPAGEDSRGLPVGFQIVGKPFGEGEVLGVAHWIEQALLDS